MPKKLPLVFLLDNSASMGYPNSNGKTSIEMLNDAVNSYLNNIRRNSRIRNIVEISFVFFNMECSATDFKPVDAWENLNFTETRGSTDLSKAIFYTYDKVLKKVEDNKALDGDCYCPIVVLVTDAEANDAIDKREKAIALVNDHCEKHRGENKEIVIPIVVGIGDLCEEAKDNLYKLSKGFTGGYIEVNGDTEKMEEAFEFAFRFISYSVSKSMSLNSNCKEFLELLYEKVRKSMEEDFGEDYCGERIGKPFYVGDDKYK